MKMKNNLDFGSACLIVALIVLIIIIVYTAGSNTLVRISNDVTNASMYSKPTWPDPTPVPTTESVEETEETEEEIEDEEEDDYEED